MDGKKSDDNITAGGKIRELIGKEISIRRTGKGALVADIATFLIAFFFARTHVAFGTYPLAIALIATLNHRVILAALGAVVGALSLGSVGVIFAILIPLTLCLRLILTPPDQARFSESYVIRVACAAIASSLGGLYEMILGAFSFVSILFATVGLLLAVAISFSFYGLFATRVTLDRLRAAKLTLKGGAEATDVWLFQGSALLFAFFVSLSLLPYSLFGISLSFVFASALSLFTSSRLGWARGMACGFFAGFAVSAVGAVGIALAGLAAGILFSVGAGYALIGGAVALSVWCGYAAGAAGFLSVFPEYGVSAIVMLPIFRAKGQTDEQAHLTPNEGRAQSMVDAMVNAGADALSVEKALLNIASSMRNFFGADGGVSFSDYRNIVIGLFAGLDPLPCEENIDMLASKLYKKRRISSEDLTRLLGDGAARRYEELLRVVADYERECYLSSRGEGVVGEYEHISRMLSQKRYKSERDMTPDPSLTEKLKVAFRDCGFPDGALSAVGTRRKCVIAAAEDSDGKRISSPEVKAALSSAAGFGFGEFEYYKRDNTSLIKCYSTPEYSVEYSVAQCASDRTGVSGDKTALIEKEGVFYSILSDGMGSGEDAARVAGFVVDYLSNTLVPDTPSARESVASLSGILRGRRDECAATADVFSFDLYTGECRLTKCGAAPSYIKRRDSVFAVRSGTSPMGLIKGTDADEMCAEVGVGDTVIMISDGAAPIPDEAVWLIEFLARPVNMCAEAYATEILEMARAHQGTGDDITVAVLKIHPADGKKCA